MIFYETKKKTYKNTRIRLRNIQMTEDRNKNKTITNKASNKRAHLTKQSKKEKVKLKITNKSTNPQRRKPVI